MAINPRTVAMAARFKRARDRGRVGLIMVSSFQAPLPVSAARFPGPCLLEVRFNFMRRAECAARYHIDRMFVDTHQHIAPEPLDRLNARPCIAGAVERRGLLRTRIPGDYRCSTMTRTGIMNATNVQAARMRATGKLYTASRNDCARQIAPASISATEVCRGAVVSAPSRTLDNASPVIGKPPQATSSHPAATSIRAALGAVGRFFIVSANSVGW
jgi:hypothetical protein